MAILEIAGEWFYNFVGLVSSDLVAEGVFGDISWFDKAPAFDFVFYEARGIFFVGRALPLISIDPVAISLLVFILDA